MSASRIKGIIRYKKPAFLLFFGLLSLIGLAQESSNFSKTKYFVSTYSGIRSTPMGVRIGFFENKGGYIGVRFGKGVLYEEDILNNRKQTDVILFSATVGMISLPVQINKNFRAHFFLGIGYGSWFERLSQNGTTVGCELESGVIISHKKLAISLGGNVLMGDGNSPKGDATIGLGYKF